MNKKFFQYIFVLFALGSAFLLSGCSNSTTADIAATQTNESEMVAQFAVKTELAIKPTVEPTLELDVTQIAINEKEKVASFLTDYHNYLQANDVNGALGILASALEIFPNNRDVLLTRAQLYFETLQFDEALNDVQQVLTSTADDTSALYLLGNIYFSQGEREEAVEAFEKVISLDANYLDAYIQLGFLYYDSQEVDKSINTFNQYIALAEDGEDKNYIIDFVDTLESIQSTQETQDSQDKTNE